MANKPTRNNTQLNDPNREIIRINKDGLLECVKGDGTVLWVQKPNTAPRSAVMRKQVAQKNRHKHDHKGIVVVDQNDNIIKVPYTDALLQVYKNCWPYLEEVANCIVRRIVEGETLKEICSDDDMPPLYVVSRWRVEIPGFKARIQEARAMRAENYHDEIVKVKDRVDEKTAKSAKVKLDALKHLAAVDDPDTYGSKTKITGDPNAPVSFIFNTGINRTDPENKTLPPQEAAIPAEGKTLDDDDSEGQEGC